MPNAATCTDCMYDGPVAPPEPPQLWLKTGAPFTATYTGTCIGCDTTDIRIGDQIQRWDRGDRTAYLHARCTP